MFDAGFDVGVGGEDELADGDGVRRGAGFEFDMAHEFARALEDA